MARKIKETPLDPERFELIKKRCTYIRGIYGERNTIMDKMEEIFLMLWNENTPVDPNIVKIINPDGRNKLLGGHRLLKATEPKVKIPFEKNDKKAKEASSKLEKAGSALFYANSRLMDIPIHEEAIKSAMLFGEIQGGITLTADLVRLADKGSSKAYKKRVEEIEKRTPALVEWYDPRTGYPIIDKLGLAGFHRSVQMSAWEIKNVWGTKAAGIIGEIEKKGKPTSKKATEFQTNYTYNDYLDWELHVVWLEEYPDMPLMYEEHNMDEIPIVYRTASGSNLHKKTEYKTQPFLYGVHKSGLYEALNMAYSMLYDHAFTLGASGNLIYEAEKDDKSLRIDWGTKGGVITIKAGEKVYSAPLPQLDPSVLKSIEMGERKLTQSTIYDQALGEPLGSNAPYSMVALLNHAGRLPLLDAQRAAAWAFGDVIEKTFRMIKKYSPGKVNMEGRTGYVALAGKDIPKDFIVNVGVEIDLPQDMKQNAMVADMIIKSGIGSKEWVREKLMQIEQSDEMDKEILIEKLVDLFAQMQVQQVMAAAQQAAAAQAGQGTEGIPEELMNMDPEKLKQFMANGGIPEDAQAEVMSKLGQRGGPMPKPGEGEGASSGNPMTKPRPIAPEGGEPPKAPPAVGGISRG